MNDQNAQKIEPDDFAQALAELQNHSEVSVDALVEIQNSAEKFARMRRSGNILVQKVMSQPVITVTADCTLSDAAHLLLTHNISGLPVVDAYNKLAGIITEADFLRALGIASHYPSHSLWQTLENMFNQHEIVLQPEGLVADLMMIRVVTVSPLQTLQNAVDVMKQNKVKRLIVTDDSERVTGIVTRSNLVQIFSIILKPQVKTGRENNLLCYALT